MLAITAAATGGHYCGEDTHHSGTLVETPIKRTSNWLLGRNGLNLLLNGCGVKISSKGTSLGGRQRAAARNEFQSLRMEFYFKMRWI